MMGGAVTTRVKFFAEAKNGRPRAANEFLLVVSRLAEKVGFEPAWSAARARAALLIVFGEWDVTVDRI